MLKSRLVLRLCNAFPRIAVRYQTSGHPHNTTANRTSVSTDSVVTSTNESAITAKKPQGNTSQNLKTATSSSAPAKKFNRKPISRKLKDIAQQITQSVTDADPQNLSEAVDIFEEGVSYLRDIQQNEAIDDEFFFKYFQATATSLLTKAIESQNNQVISRVFDIMTTNRVAHNFHFGQYQQYLLLQGKYSEILTVWLQYLEYSKASEPRMQFVMSRPFGHHTDSKFLNYYSRNVAYFAYVTQCSAAGVEQSLVDTLKLLQIEDIALLPTPAQMRFTLKDSLSIDSVKQDFKKFEQQAQALSIKMLDPNGDAMAKRITLLSKRGNFRQLKQFYEKMLAASVENNLPLKEESLARVMTAFVDLHQFADAFEVFNTMTTKFQPTLTSWALLLKAIGHPKHVAFLSDSEKMTMAQNVTSTIASMEAMGVPMDAKSLAVAVGAMSNLNQQKEVQVLLKKYANIPMVQLTRHNILLGMILNNQTAEAEKLMQRYLKDVPNYTPSIHLLNSFMSSYVNNDNLEAVDAIMKFMKEKGIESDIGTLTTVVNCYFKTCKANGIIPDVKSVLVDMNKVNMKWDANMASTLLSGLTQDGSSLDAARAVFKHFVELGPQYKNSPALYTAMIKSELDFGDAEVAEGMFKWYNENLKLETRMWNMMITGFLSKNEEKALNIYKKMVTSSVEPNYYTFYYLLTNALQKGNKKQVQWVIDEIEGSKIQDLGQVLPNKLEQLKLQYKLGPKLLKKLGNSKKIQ